MSVIVELFSLLETPATSMVSFVLTIFLVLIGTDMFSVSVLWVFRFFGLLLLSSTVTDCVGSSWLAIMFLLEPNLLVGLVLYSGLSIHNMVGEVTGVSIEEGLVAGVLILRR